MERSMSSEIVVPELGESIVEATVGRWLKKEGDPVSAGEPVVTLETEKVNLDVGASQAGVLAHISRKEGEDVKIGEVLGSIEPAANGSPPQPKAQSPATPAPAKPTTPAKSNRPSHEI